MKKLIFVVLSVVGLLGVTLWAADDRAKELDRVQAATDVLNEIMAAPDKGIPEEILPKAECVAVVPSLKKGGFIVGASYGKGVATCRTGKVWSALAPIKLEGGSLGFQIGGEAVDLLMLVMNQKGMDQLLDSKFKIGADVSGAAGPVGRHAEANTDWKMRAEVLTYSRARGAFAGVTLNGASITQDRDDTKLLYGRDVSFRNILSGAVPPPAGTQAFLQTVARDFREARVAEGEKGSTAAGAGSSGGVTGTLTGHGEEAKSAPPRSVGIAAASSSANNPSAATPVSDAKQVQDEVAAAMKDQIGNDADAIVISVNAKTIRLSGSVPNRDVKDKAVQLAQSKAGDRQVDASELKVK